MVCHWGSPGGRHANRVSISAAMGSSADPLRSPYGASVEELAQELSVSEKTIRRDVQPFREAGVLIGGQEGEGSWPTWILGWPRRPGRRFGRGDVERDEGWAGSVEPPLAAGGFRSTVKRSPKQNTIRFRAVVCAFTHGATSGDPVSSTPAALPLLGNAPWAVRGR